MIYSVHLVSRDHGEVVYSGSCETLKKVGIQGRTPPTLTRHAAAQDVTVESSRSEGIFVSLIMSH